MAVGDPIADLSELIVLATGGSGGAPEAVNFVKKPLRAGAAPQAPIIGRLQSLWEIDGCPSGGSTTAPTTAAVCTNATDGSLKQTTSATGAKKRLLSIAMCGLVAGSVVVYDRLSHQGGLSATTTGAQTTNLPTAALTRYTTGEGVEAWIDIYTQIGTTGTTATASYTDQGGTSGNTSPAFTFGATNAREAQRQLPIAYAVGDSGVRAVANVNVVATTGTAGAFGVTLAYPLITINLPLPGVGALISFIEASGGPLDLGATSDAAIATSWFPNTTTIPELFGQFFFLEK